VSKPAQLFALLVSATVMLAGCTAASDTSSSSRPADSATPSAAVHRSSSGEAPAWTKQCLPYGADDARIRTFDGMPLREVRRKSADAVWDEVIVVGRAGRCFGFVPNSAALFVALDRRSRVVSAAGLADELRYGASPLELSSSG
jgi:hypothetical protein